MKKILLLLLPAALFATSPVDTIVEGERANLEQLTTAGYPDLIDIVNMQVYSVGHHGSMITLSDHSMWVVRPNDAWRVVHWPSAFDEQYGIPATVVYLTVNDSYYFSTQWRYKVVNILTGESALVNLSVPPAYSCMNKICSIDEWEGILVIQSTSGQFAVFSLSGYDRALYRKWLVGDRIILGRNTSWNSSWCPFLLINIDSKNHVRGILTDF